MPNRTCAEAGAVAEAAKPHTKTTPIPILAIVFMTTLLSSGLANLHYRDNALRDVQPIHLPFIARENAVNPAVFGRSDVEVLICRHSVGALELSHRAQICHRNRLTTRWLSPLDIDPAGQKLSIGFLSASGSSVYSASPGKSVRHTIPEINYAHCECGWYFAGLVKIPPRMANRTSSGQAPEIAATPRCSPRRPFRLAQAIVLRRDSYFAYLMIVFIWTPAA